VFLAAWSVDGKEAAPPQVANIFPGQFCEMIVVSVVQQ
jgi:hypothetical protein